ncbi:hypothetical protein BDZ89DRAFT_1163703 [Hymenopellis radicata]|nr:hypothetical protein BDZ89DRAFT_1163703 [Hymenopellis radicata]
MDTANDFSDKVNLVAHNDAPGFGQNDPMDQSGMYQDSSSHSAASMAHADVVHTGLKSDSQSSLDTLYQSANSSPIASPGLFSMAPCIHPLRGVFDAPNQQLTSIPADSAAEIDHITSSIAEVTLQDACMAPAMTSQQNGETLTEISTYAEATNVAQFFPELASIVLHQPLPFSIHIPPNFDFKNIKEPPPQVAEHTYDRPNWAIAPEETPAKSSPVDVPNWALVPDDKPPSTRNPSRLGSSNWDSPSLRKQHGRRAVISRHDQDRRQMNSLRPHSHEAHNIDVPTVNFPPTISHFAISPQSQMSSSSTPYPGAMDCELSPASGNVCGMRMPVVYEGSKRHERNRQSSNDALPRQDGSVDSEQPSSSSHQQPSRHYEDRGARGDRQSTETYQPSQWLKVWDESREKHLDQLSDDIRLQESSVANGSQPASFDSSLDDDASPVCHEGKVLVTPLTDDISGSIQQPLKVWPKAEVPYKCKESVPLLPDCGEGNYVPRLAPEAVEENSLHEATMSKPELPIFSTVRGDSVRGDGWIVVNHRHVGRSDSNVPLPSDGYVASEECAMVLGSVREGKSQVSSPPPSIEVPAKCPQTTRGKDSSEFDSSDATFFSLRTGPKASTNPSSELDYLELSVSPQRPRDAASATSKPAGRVSRTSDVTDRSSMKLRTPMKPQNLSAICPSDTMSPRKRQRSSSLGHKKSFDKLHIPVNPPNYSSSSSDTEMTSGTLETSLPKAPDSAGSDNCKRSKRDSDGLSWRSGKSVADWRAGLRDQSMGPKYVPPPARSVSFRSTKITREFQEGRGYTFRLEPLEPEQEIVKSVMSPTDREGVNELEHGQEGHRRSALSTPAPKHDSELVAQVSKARVSPSPALSPSRIASPLADVRRRTDNVVNTSPLLSHAVPAIASPNSSFTALSSGKDNYSAVQHILQQGVEMDSFKGKPASDQGKENNTQSSDSPVSSPRVHHSPLMSRSVGMQSSLITQVTGSSGKTLTWSPSREFIPKQSSLCHANSKLRSLDDPPISASEEMLNLDPSNMSCGSSRTGIEQQTQSARELFEARLHAHNIRIQQAQSKQHESVSRGDIIDISPWTAPTSAQRTLRYHRPSDDVIQLPARSPTFEFGPISRTFSGPNGLPRTNVQSSEVYVANAVPDQHLHQYVQSSQSPPGPIENLDFWIPSMQETTSRVHAFKMDSITLHERTVWKLVYRLSYLVFDQFRLILNAKCAMITIRLGACGVEEVSVNSFAFTSPCGPMQGHTQF